MIAIKKNTITNGVDVTTTYTVSKESAKQKEQDVRDDPDIIELAGTGYVYSVKSISDDEWQVIIKDAPKGNRGTFGQ